MSQVVVQSLDLGQLDRKHLAEPTVAVFDDHVAAGLELQVVQRGLEVETPTIERGRQGEHRLLETAPQRAVALEGVGDVRRSRPRDHCSSSVRAANRIDPLARVS
jgi:hypothetical protein